jgi:hypothetical protein
MQLIEKATGEESKGEWSSALTTYRSALEMFLKAAEGNEISQKFHN